MTTLTIGDVAKRVGLQPSALRYYEEIGLLPEPERVNGRRVYTAEIFRPIASIQLAKQAGFTLEEIGVLLYGAEGETAAHYAERWQQLAQEKLQELEVLITAAREMQQRLQEGLNCHCQTTAGCDMITEHMTQMLAVSQS